MKKKLIIKLILNNQDEVMVLNRQPRLLKICDHTNKHKSWNGVKHANILCTLYTCMLIKNAKNDVNMLIACAIIHNLNSCNFEPKSPQINGASSI
jgi:hypothetical protein